MTIVCQMCNQPIVPGSWHVPSGRIGLCEVKNHKKEKKK